MELSSAFPFRSLDILRSLNDEEIETLKERLRRQSFEAGQQVSGEGAESEELYIIARAKIRLVGTDRETRPETFAPGTIFDEIALLDTEPRSATIAADEPLVCYVLKADDFNAVKRSHPAIATTLLTSSGRELSCRLRRANRFICQLGT